MSNRSTGKVVVIGGGSRGLGQALVTDFLERGDIVATFSRTPTPFIKGLQPTWLPAGLGPWACSWRAGWRGKERGTYS